MSILRELSNEIDKVASNSPTYMGYMGSQLPSFAAEMGGLSAMGVSGIMSRSKAKNKNQLLIKGLMALGALTASAGAIGSIKSNIDFQKDSGHEFNSVGRGLGASFLGGVLSPLGMVSAVRMAKRARNESDINDKALISSDKLDDVLKSVNSRLGDSLSYNRSMFSENGLHSLSSDRDGARALRALADLGDANEDYSDEMSALNKLRKKKRKGMFFGIRKESSLTSKAGKKLSEMSPAELKAMQNKFKSAFTKKVKK